MRSTAKLVALLVFALPALALAQSSEPMNRAQAREKLMQLERAGYSPLVNDPLYPRRLLQAEATLSKPQAPDAAYAQESGGTVQSGR
ncbi:DUF4148 domain-containing protein [Burkholderia pseudomultivorans]|uniref:DUF4148 domain-containing protein n=1 Tax=Burkholderia pseudomultivorans TaxID=1207504 RepID=UPI0009BEA51B|nr:DUF4148 domain-containing protein [Burkholderia pseudomultivorans]